MALNTVSVLCAAALIASVATPVEAQSSANVLLVVNSTSRESVEIGQYYAAARQIPENQIVKVAALSGDSLSRASFEANIQAPIVEFLAKHLLHDRILYIVLTKGIPLRIDGTDGVNGTVASVDSELTLLYRRMTGAMVPVIGRLENPLFLGDRPVKEAKRFSRVDSDLYLVTRLDGFTVTDVKALIDRGVRPVTDGKIVLDQRATATGDRGGDAWLQEAANRLTATDQGARVHLESTREVARATGPVLGYFSWGSNDPSNQQRLMGMSFANGAVGGLFVSTDARTFREPNPQWKPGSAGLGGQSLVGDLIREGITGVAGHVAEPYLDSIVRPQILFPAYLSGFNLAESFYMSMPYLSWQDIVVGDPLCAPFQRAPLQDDQIHRGIDKSTSLPSLFAERRLRVLTTVNPSLNVEGLKLSLLGWSMAAQEQPPAQIDSVLESATALEPRLPPAQLRLASEAERRQDFENAITRYRAVLSVEPSNVFALNNLAYLLADKKNQPRDALDMAERAYRLSGEAAFIADTLGWVYFKLGDTAKALPLLDRAAKAGGANVDILVHAATAHAAAGNPVQSRAYLDAALKADPKAAERADVKALIGKLVN